MKSVSPYRRWRGWRARRVWLRSPSRAAALLRSEQQSGGAREAGLLAWLVLMYERDDAEAEQLARAALERPGEQRYAIATLATLMLRRGDHDGAIELLEQTRERYPEIVWYDLTLADALAEGGRTAEAERLLEQSARRPSLRRHALKRLSGLALERGDREAARELFEQLVALAPDYLVYASDHVTVGRLQLEDGDRETARETWREGARIYPRNGELRELLSEHFGERPASEPRIKPVSEEAVGAQRIPVRTPFISPRTGVVDVIDSATADLREPGDVLAVAESAVAAGQGRILPLELVDPGPLARFLSGFVGSAGPLHSPEGMHGAIMEAGRPRVVLATVAAAIGRLLKRRGWFYRVAGPATAMIDDVAACTPPHDHHLIFGPGAPGVAEGLAAGIGWPVAIVDANHQTGAWVVDASKGIDRDWLARALADNPAGNEDEQTPVVLVRPLNRRP
jgi:tetratricopeptide (TPR) repeat protein